MSEPTPSQCAGCPMHNLAQLVKLGVNMKNWDHVVALAGNPNTGKSTVFNALTGLRQHVGNWPGKTVARAEGGFEYKGEKFKLVDLPGTYSLLSASTDEENRAVHSHRSDLRNKEDQGQPANGTRNGECNEKVLRAL